ncbi:hypothetical protein HQ563_18165 [bacterium]|nr:hypothetical protein [bacterium]
MRPQNRMLCQRFDIGGNPVHLVTNDTLILQAVSGWLNSFLCSKTEEGIKLCLLSGDGDSPIAIPEGVVHRCSEYLSEHFLYKDFWLIDFHGSGTMVVDREKEMALGFVQSDCLRERFWLYRSLVHPLFELLRRRGLYLAHSGAVSFGGRGLLIPGESGKGKTTLTLYLVREGCGFLSDDRCLLRKTVSGFEALSFPEQVRVYPENVANLPEFQFLQDHKQKNKWKKSFDIRKLYPNCTVRKAELEAIVFPRWDSGGKSRLEAISPSEAMIEMLPLTLEAFFPDTARAHFEFIGDLMEKIPSFRLYLGDDRGKWHQIARELIQ